jgi:hypothetical protein
MKKRGRGRPRKFVVGDKVMMKNGKEGKIVDCYKKIYPNSHSFCYVVKYSETIVVERMNECVADQLLKIGGEIK